MFRAGPGHVFGLLSNCHVPQIFHIGPMLKDFFLNYCIYVLTPESLCTCLLGPRHHLYRPTHYTSISCLSTIVMQRPRDNQYTSVTLLKTTSQ